MRGFRLSMILIAVAALASGCGASLYPPNTGTSTSTFSTALAVTSIQPGSGSYASQPTQIQIGFSEGNLDITSASALTSYTITCGASSAYATNVSYISGNSEVNITVPSLNVSAGTTCQLIVGEVLDTYGNVADGYRSVSYVIGAASSTFSWTEQSSVTLIPAGGSQAPSTFDQAAATGLALSGVNVQVLSTTQNGITYDVLGGVQGVWENSAGTASSGTLEGGATNAALACPTGSRVTGLYGYYYGSYVSALGVFCNTDTLTSSYTSSFQGTATGSYFTVNCPQGEFATTLYGAVSGEVEDVGIGCQ